MADVAEAAVGFATANVTLTTSAETVVVTSDEIFLPRRNHRVLVHGLAELTTGGSTTAVTPRIRRASLTGALVGEANAITIGAAAGSTEIFEKCVVDDVDNLDSVIYVLTLAQTGAAADGTSLSACIKVLAL